MDIKNLLGEIAVEIDTEKEQEMTPQERRYHDLAQQLLLLERDLRAPGTAVSVDARVDRLLEKIAGEKF